MMTPTRIVMERKNHFVHIGSDTFNLDNPVDLPKVVALFSQKDFIRNAVETSRSWQDKVEQAEQIVGILNLFSDDDLAKVFNVGDAAKTLIKRDQMESTSRLIMRLSPALQARNLTDYGVATTIIDEVGGALFLNVILPNLPIVIQPYVLHDSDTQKSLKLRPDLYAKAQNIEANWPRPEEPKEADKQHPLDTLTP
ncbi:MAG: hypothetical protein WC464_05315 [Bdellovibrionales bacterium]